MNSSDRFEEEERLDLIEQISGREEHAKRGAASDEARDVAEGLLRQDAALRGDLEPPPEWRARVWQAIDAEREAEELGLLGRMFGFGGGAMRWAAPLGAVAALVLVSVIWFGQPDGEPFLQHSVRAGGAIVRGDDVHPGDVLQLTAGTGGRRYAELRLYFNDTQLVVGCFSEAPCELDGDTITADVVLESLGIYQALLLLSDQPLPASTGNLDADAGAALDAGARVELGERIPVR